jgi:hypothetical protein
MKIHTVRFDVFHADTQVDRERDGRTARHTKMMKLLVAFASLRTRLQITDVSFVS